MAFGSGVLISAVAYELVDEAFAKAGGSGRVAGGLAAGASAFYFGDLYIDKRAARTGSAPAGSRRTATRGRSCSGRCSTGSPRES